MKNLRKNFFGMNYPTDNHDILVEIFSISEGEFVLDVGGGHTPFSRADVIVEIDLSEGRQRDGKKIAFEKDNRFIAADITSLPFKEKTFDFVFCSHVLEHVIDPAQACEELMRVTRRGYIETPRKWTEFYAGHPSHRWLVDIVDGKLFFEKRRFLDSPFMNFMLPQVWKDSELYERALTTFRNITCVQFYWEGSFEYRVDDDVTDGDFNYNNPEQAAYSHYCFARNILKFNSPPEYGLFHAETAVKLVPANDEYRKLLELYYSLMKEKKI
jgi:SAM-dependent methyltransferase